MGLQNLRQHKRPQMEPFRIICADGAAREQLPLMMDPRQLRQNPAADEQTVDIVGVIAAAGCLVNAMVTRWGCVVCVGVCAVALHWIRCAGPAQSRSQLRNPDRSGGRYHPPLSEQENDRPTGLG